MIQNNFRALTQLEAWCQKVLPLVYDESLSYYELLCKVLEKVNALIENNNNLPQYILDLIKEYIQGPEFQQIMSDLLSALFINVKFPPTGIPPAVGDGSADDTLSLQGCIDYAAARNLTVFIPAGVYLTQSLVFKSKASIFGMDSNTTRLVLKGGATAPLVTGNVDGIGIHNISFDANMDIQVNNIDCVSLSCANTTLENLFFVDGYDNLVVEKTGGYINLKNLIFGKAVVHNMVVGGAAGNIYADGITFGTLSTLNGESCLMTDASGDVYKNLYSWANVPIGVEVEGNNNTFEGYIVATQPIIDEGNNNTIYLQKTEAKEILTGDVNLKANAISITATNGIERMASNIDDSASNTINQSANVFNATGTSTSTIRGNAVNISAGTTATVSGTDVVLSPTNPLTYGTVSPYSQFFDKIPLKQANGSQYSVLVANAQTPLITRTDLANVLDYGAKGDGVTNDTQAFINCINENASIFIPIGTYVLDTIVIPRQKYIVGESNTMTILKLNNTLKIGDGSALVNYTILENLFINNEANTTTAIELRSCQNTKLRDIIIAQGADTGATAIDLVSKVYTSYFSATIYYGGVAAHLGGQSNGNDFVDFNVYYPTSAMVIDDSNNTRMIGCTVQSYTISGVTLTQGSVSNSIIGNYFEANPAPGTLEAGIVDNSGVTNFFIGNRFSLIAASGKKFVQIGPNSKPYVIGADTQSFINYNSTYQQTKYIPVTKDNLQTASADNNGVLVGVEERGFGTRLYFSKLRGGDYMWGEVAVFNPDGSLDMATLSGSTAQRPEGAYQGLQYFDMTIGKPIWFNTGKWVDATGTEV